jgi:hypothetical protein
VKPESSFSCSSQLARKPSWALPAPTHSFHVALRGVDLAEAAAFNSYSRWQI